MSETGQNPTMRALAISPGGLAGPRANSAEASRALARRPRGPARAEASRALAISAEASRALALSVEASRARGVRFTHLVF